MNKQAATLIALILLSATPAVADETSASASATVQTAAQPTHASRDRADASRLLGRHKKAIEMYGEAIADDPKDAQAVAGRGVCFVATGKYAAAIEDYTHAIELTKDSEASHWLPVYQANRGEAHIRLQHYQEAAEDYSAALKSRSRESDLTKRGDAHRTLGEYKDAAMCYRQELGGNTQASAHIEHPKRRTALKVAKVLARAACAAGAEYGDALQRSAAYQPTYSAPSSNWQTTSQLQSMNMNLSNINTQLMFMNLRGY